MRLEELLARAEIAEIIGPRYASAMDWFDLDLLKSCFHADARVDYGYFQGNAHDWATMRIAKPEPGLLHRFHYTFPARIELTGSTARAESSGIAGVRTHTDDGPHSAYFGSRYLDRLELRDGAWRISERIVGIDFVESSTGGSAKGMHATLELLRGLGPTHPLHAHRAS